MSRGLNETFPVIRLRSVVSNTFVQYTHLLYSVTLNRVERFYPNTD